MINKRNRNTLLNINNTIALENNFPKAIKHNSKILPLFRMADHQLNFLQEQVPELAGTEL